MKKTVLVIDNDQPSASAIAKTLEAEGYLVFTAASGEAALTMAKKVTPMVVFLNLAAPGAGLEICKSIHAIAAIKEVPIVLLTVRESKFDPRYKELYGIVGFLKKPLTPETIFSSLGTALGATEEVAGAEEFAAGFAQETSPAGGPASFRAGGPATFGGYEAAEAPEAEQNAFAGYDTQKPAEPAEEPASPFKGTQPFKMEESEPQRKEYDFDGARPFEGTRPFEGGESVEELFERPAISAKKDEPKGSGRSLIKPLAAVLGVAVLTVAAYIAYKLLMPPGAQGRKPAATTVALNLPSKPLKKPQPSGLVSPSTGPALSIVSEAEAAAKAPKPSEKVALPPSGKIEPQKAAPPIAKEVAPPAPSKGIVYFVQLGAFGSEQNAQNFQKELKAKGLETSVYQGMAQGKTIYRVAAARLEKKSAAADMAQKIKAEKNLVAVLTKEGVERPSALPKIKEPKAKKTKAEKGIVYFVQLGAFGSEKNAQDFQKELKAKGLDASIYQGMAQGKTIYRVAAAKLQSKRAAIDAANKIRSEKKFEAVVTKEAGPLTP